MLRIVATLAALLAGAGPAIAAPEPEPIMPPFPTARDDVSVMLWLRRNTSLGVGRSVVFGPDNVLVIVDDAIDAAAADVHRVSFRQEATLVDFVARTGGRSVRGETDVNCASGQVRASAISLHAGTDLRGDEITKQGPDADWRFPAPGSASALAMAEVCQKPS